MRFNIQADRLYLKAAKCYMPYCAQLVESELL